ncbi:MAG: flavodoxin domain-containing protein [Candidatus Bathyarchaeota archaeon]
MVEVLVLYYSRGGRTKGLAKAVAEGIESKGGSARIQRVDFATVDDFTSCDAVAFGSPNYFSYMAGIMKDFFDKALTVREKVSGKPAVAFSSGGGSSDAALVSLEKMIGFFRLEKVVDGIISQGEPTKQDLEACRKLGEALTAKALERAEPPRD